MVNALSSAALQDRAAGVADVIAVLLQAGRHLEFIGQDVLAKAMRVAAAGSFLCRSVRHALWAQADPVPTSRAASKLRV